MTHDLPQGTDYNHDDGQSHAGLQLDLQRLSLQALHRRAALQRLAGVSALALWGCGGGGGASESAAAATPGGATGGGTGGTGGTGGGSTSTCSVIPEETAGPFPGDGSNTAGGGIANALALSGVVRSNIRSSFAGASAVAGGVPLTVKLRIVNTNGSCADLAAYAVYLWHCDREGRYSMYSIGVTAENYLRGVQATDSNGTATFETIFPGCYAGRVPHLHFEIFRSANTATVFSNRLKTSQLAFPVATCNEVYALAGYEASVTNFRAVSFASDNVFSDGVNTQLATVTGSAAAGYVATLTVGIAT
jgi:protocatechuate 3,4-dioxygenase beta subunit